MNDRRQDRQGRARTPEDRVRIGRRDRQRRLVLGGRGRARDQVVRLDARTGRPIGDPIRSPFRPHARGGGRRVWAGRPRQRRAGSAGRIDPKTGEVGAPVPYPYGILSMTSSPTAIWVAARRRALIQRVDPDDRATCSSRSGSAAIAARTSSTAAAGCGSPRRRTTWSTRSARRPASDPDQRRPVPAPARGQPTTPST